MDEVTNAIELVCTEQKGRTLREMVTALITKFLQAKMKHAKTSVALYSTTVEDSKRFFMREVTGTKFEKLKPCGSVGFQIDQEAEEDGPGDAAAGGADRLFS